MRHPDIGSTRLKADPFDMVLKLEHLRTLGLSEITGGSTTTTRCAWRNCASCAREMREIEAFRQEMQEGGLFVDMEFE